MNIAIRPLQNEEILEALFALDQYAFNPSPPFQNKEEWLGFVRERMGSICSAAFEGDQIVSIAASSVMTQNIRGVLYPTAGIWGVSTHPSSRRKGYCRQTIERLLAAEREAGKVFTNLYPFRESFYERLGYITFPKTKLAGFATQSLAPLLKLEMGGEVEMVLIGEGYETYRQYLAQVRLRRHGMAFADFGNQKAANRNRQWIAFARFSGQIEGAMLYSLQGEPPTKFNFAASRFLYQTSRARYLLLNWIARHIDQAHRAEIQLPADETPETWLADIQVELRSSTRDAAMGRVLDVAKIGGMRVGEGSFSAQIIDPLCPWNQGAWRFEASDGSLLVSKTSAADCELTIQGLSALVAGAHDPRDFPLRGWCNADARLQAAQRSLFPAMSPYLYEEF